MTKPTMPSPRFQKDGRSRPSSLCFLCQKRCTPSLYHIRTVIHSIHDSFVEICGGLSYHLRSRHRTAFVILIIPPSSPFSYHLRSARIFQPPANQPIPQFPSFPNFPRFPRIPAFPCFPRHPVHPFLFMVHFVIIHGDIQKPLSFSARPGGGSGNLSKNC